MRSAETGGALVRLAGDFPRPGLYHFPDGTTVATAIKMTHPAAPLPEGVKEVSTKALVSGDLLTLQLLDGKIVELSLTEMEVKERMLVGIPLHPDQLDAAGWALLPGIGPVLSERIIADRHKYGAFGSLKGVLRVPGVGPRKLEAIKSYF